jgi:hypothetical protein
LFYHEGIVKEKTSKNTEKYPQSPINDEIKNERFSPRINQNLASSKVTNNPNTQNSNEDPMGDDDLEAEKREKLQKLEKFYKLPRKNLEEILIKNNLDVEKTIEGISSFIFENFNNSF